MTLLNLELKEDVSIETLDVLRNPGELEKQLKLQYVIRFTLFCILIQLPLVRRVRVYLLSASWDLHSRPSGNSRKKPVKFTVR